MYVPEISCPKKSIYYEKKMRLLPSPRKFTTDYKWKIKDRAKITIFDDDNL